MERMADARVWERGIWTKMIAHVPILVGLPTRPSYVTRRVGFAFHFPSRFTAYDIPLGWAHIPWRGWATPVFGEKGSE